MKRFVTIGLATLALATATFTADARFPEKTITLVIGSAPGGGTDVIARLLAAKLAEILHQSVIVENRPSADAKIASDHVARSPADGYTLLLTTATLTIDTAFAPDMRPNALQDFAPVSQIAATDIVLVVNATLPVRSVRELVAYARAAPGGLNFSSPGAKSTLRLEGEIFKQQTHTDFVHVPYHGAGPSLTALVAGDVQMSFQSLAAVLPYVNSGRLRALAVASRRRSALLPDVPTTQEAGVDGLEAGIWYGVLAPAGTPRGAVETLARAIAEATSSADYRQRIANTGAQPLATTPETFGAMIRDEVAKWREVIRDAGIRAE